jgi:hypothetical protein
MASRPWRLGSSRLGFRGNGGDQYRHSTPIDGTSGSQLSTFSLSAAEPSAPSGFLSTLSTT